MTALTVGAPLNIIKHSASRVRVRVKHGSADRSFARGAKALHYGVIPAVPRAAHTWRERRLGKAIARRRWKAPKLRACCSKSAGSSGTTSLVHKSRLSKQGCVDDGHDVAYDWLGIGTARDMPVVLDPQAYHKSLVPSQF